jgi:hypothetical protein
MPYERVCAQRWCGCIEKLVPANGPAEKISGFSATADLPWRRLAEQVLGDEVLAALTISAGISRLSIVRSPS